MILDYLDWIIIGITVVTSIMAWQDPTKMQKWIFSPYDVKRNNTYGRFLTSGFIHADQTHLFFNMLSFYFFAPHVIYVFSQRTSYPVLAFLGLYFGAIIISELPTYFKHQDNYNYRSLGASGGVSAIVFSMILYQPWAQFNLYMIIPIPAIIFGSGYLIYSHVSQKNSVGNVNHSAHIWGAIAGLVGTILIDPSVLPYFINQLFHPTF